MEETIVIIDDKNEILHILNFFTPCLKSLRDRLVDKNSLADKFYKNGIVILISERDLPKGFAAFYCNDLSTHIAYLSMLAVSPNNEGKGYGRKLMKSIINISREKEMKILKLEVNKMNHRAISFYHALGFINTDENDSSFFMELSVL